MLTNNEIMYSVRIAKTLIFDNLCKDIWMDQKTIALLLDTGLRNVRKHLKNKIDNGELSRDENTINPKKGTNSSFPLISSESTKQPILYNFEAIIAVTFSVNSKRALKVRRWANKTLVNASGTDIKL